MCSSDLMDVIKTADWLIDLGPEGGDRGGEIVAVGTPEDIARVPASHTGRYLRKALSKTGYLAREEPRGLRAVPGGLGVEEREPVAAAR